MATETTLALARPATMSTVTRAVLQRKCDCGSHTPMSERCEQCANQADALQRRHSVRSDSDRYEREADRIADRVVADATPGAGPVALLRIEPYRPQSTDSGSPIPDSVSRTLSRPGTALPPALRDDMERRFGCDFSDVRAHTDTLAQRSALAVSARAYAVGRDIVFAGGRFSPGSRSGRHLIAHELTHVVQQSGGRSAAVPTPSALQKQDAAPAVDGGLTGEMLEQIAIALHEAMQGPGTDEEAIYSALAGRSEDQFNAIARVYEARYKTPLLDELRDELNASEFARLESLSRLGSFGEAPPVEAEASFGKLIAFQLNRAMDRLGTDEESVYAALTGRTQTQLREIRQAYKKLTGRELEADIQDEFSGAELKRAMALLRHGTLSLEERAYFAMKGLGTDEEELFAVFDTVKGDRAKISDLIDAFATRGFGNLLEWIGDELSGSELDRAMEVLHGETGSADCSDEERKVGLRGISGAVELAQSAISKLSTSITARNLSNTVRSALRRHFNPGGAHGAVNLGVATRVRNVLADTRADILRASNVTCTSGGLCDPKPRCNARFTYGFTTIAVPGATVSLCPAYFQCLTDKPLGMLHEFVHHIGMSDRAYLGEPRYQILTPRGDRSATDSLDNADSYARFAREVAS